MRWALGARTDKYNLANWGGVALSTLVITAAVIGVVDFNLMIAPRAARIVPSSLGPSNVCLGGVILAGIVVLVRSLGQISLVVYENGFEHIGLLGKRTVLWQDIEAVSMDFQVRKPFKFEGWMVIFFFVSWLIFVAFILADIVLVRSGSRFGIWLKDGRELHIRGGIGLAPFQDVLNKQLVAHLAASTLEEVKSGQDVDLTERIAYSLKGVHGTRVRRGSHARREEPFSFLWSDYATTQIEDGWVEISGRGKTLVTIPLKDAINLAVFKAVARQMKPGKALAPEVDEEA